MQTITDAEVRMRSYGDLDTFLWDSNDTVSSNRVIAFMLRHDRLTFAAAGVFANLFESLPVFLFSLHCPWSYSAQRIWCCSQWHVTLFGSFWSKQEHDIEQSAETVLAEANDRSRSLGPLRFCFRTLPLIL